MSPTRSSRRLRNRSPLGESGPESDQDNQSQRDSGIRRSRRGDAGSASEDGVEQDAAPLAAITAASSSPSVTSDARENQHDRDATAISIPRSEKESLSTLHSLSAETPKDSQREAIYKSESSIADEVSTATGRNIASKSPLIEGQQSSTRAKQRPIGKKEDVDASRVKQSGPVSVPLVTKTTRRETLTTHQEPSEQRSVATHPSKTTQPSPPSKDTRKSGTRDSPGSFGTHGSPGQSSGDEDMMKVFMPPLPSSSARRSRPRRSRDRHVSDRVGNTKSANASGSKWNAELYDSDDGDENDMNDENVAREGELLSCFEEVGRPDFQVEDNRVGERYDRGIPVYEEDMMLSTRETTPHGPTTDHYFPTYDSNNNDDSVDADALQFSFDDSPDNSREFEPEPDYKIGASGVDSVRGSEMPETELPPFKTARAEIGPTATPSRSSVERRTNPYGMSTGSSPERSPSKKQRQPSYQTSASLPTHRPQTTSFKGPPPSHHYPYPPQPVHYHPDYSYLPPGHPQPMTSVAQHVPPSTGYHPYNSALSSPNMPPSHGVPPGYPPPPPPGYAHWGSPPAASPPGYYMYPHQYSYPPQEAPAQPPTQQSHPLSIAPHQMHPPGPATRTPAKKRERREDSDVTMETAEMSLEEESGVEPVSPPSSKKKKDIGSAGWPSHYTETDVTPQRGSAHAHRSRNDQMYSNTPTHTPGAPFGGSFDFGGTTPARDYLSHDHWSPLGSGTLFDDDEGNRVEMLAPPAPERHDFPPLGTSQFQEQKPYASSQPPRDAKAPESFVSAASPRRGGVVLRGSPIFVRGQSSAERPAIAQRPMSESKVSLRSSEPTPASLRFGVRRAAEELSAEKRSFTFKFTDGGREAYEERRGIESINSFLRSSPVSSQRRPPSAPRSVPHPSTRRFGEISGTNYPPPHQAHSIRAPGSTSQQKTPFSARKGVGKENTENDKGCNCRNSKCLKLYCQCFAAEKYCVGCKCSDCQNTVAYENIRQKAITDTRNRNPQAFKAKFSSKISPSGAPNSTQTTHTTGCKCIKSSCLKKYCVCFNAGIVCGNKCKCVDCLNYNGSQALIDRRRKIKDDTGANLAMKSSDELWKKGIQQPKVVHVPGATGGYSSTMMMSSYQSYGHHMMMPHGYPNPYGLPGQPPVLGYPHMMPRHPISYTGTQPSVQPPTPTSRKTSVSVKPAGHAVNLQKPSALRKIFDPLKFKQSSSQSAKAELNEHYFGPNVNSQTKTTTLTVFSYLANEDLFNASVVSKLWSDVATDEALWNKP